MNRLNLIEGLRGYLAFWVLIGHVLMTAGYDENQCPGFIRLLRQNWLAVDMFVIVSGFVIFLLLDKRTENYRQFICRRFFRLYPVFILLFAVSIPVSILEGWNLQHCDYLSAARIHEFTTELAATWQNAGWNILWHLPMLQGVAPDPGYVKHTDVAFLGPAWSISLEWQFYLVAPFAYLAGSSNRPLYRAGICAVCLYVFILKDYLPAGLADGYLVHGAFLPYHIDYFFFGAASYFLYKHIQVNRADVIFPLLASAAILFSFREVYFIACCWVVVLALLMERPESFFKRILSPVFTNGISQYLGRISYSIYLSHMLVIVVAQYCLLKFAPGLTQFEHFGLLLLLAATGTVLVSAMLYRFIEVPGMELGRRIASRFEKAKLGKTPDLAEQQI